MNAGHKKLLSYKVSSVIIHNLLGLQTAKDPKKKVKIFRTWRNSRFPFLITENNKKKRHRVFFLSLNVKAYAGLVF